MRFSTVYIALFGLALTATAAPTSRRDVTESESAPTKVNVADGFKFKRDEEPDGVVIADGFKIRRHEEEFSTDGVVVADGFKKRDDEPEGIAVADGF